MITIYGMIDSGNCYKPRLLMAKLGRPFRHVEVSSHDGGTRAEAFTAKNPNAMVPLLEFDDGRLLAESNAMLLHLGEGTRLVPQDAYARALAYQWLFFEQYSHEPYIAVRRALLTFPSRKKDATPERLQQTLDRGVKALGVMEKRLAEAPFFAGGEISIADIALYAYTHVAEEGGFDLSAYPHVTAWIGRVENDPGHVPMDWLPNA
jgi:glutathione S-transferase